MNKLIIFKPEMFYEDDRAFHEIANEILNKYIEEKGQRVFSNGIRGFTSTNFPGDTHFGILLNVQEIKKKCEHEPEWIEMITLESYFECSKCKVKLEPTEWKEVE